MTFIAANTNVFIFLSEKKAEEEEEDKRQSMLAQMKVKSSNESNKMAWNYVYGGLC